MKSTMLARAVANRSRERPGPALILASIIEYRLRRAHRPPVVGTPRQRAVLTTRHVRFAFPRDIRRGGGRGGGRGGRGEGGGGKRACCGGIAGEIDRRRHPRAATTRVTARLRIKRTEIRIYATGGRERIDVFRAYKYLHFPRSALREDLL